MGELGSPGGDLRIRESGIPKNQPKPKGKPVSELFKTTEKDRKKRSWSPWKYLGDQEAKGNGGKTDTSAMDAFERASRNSKTRGEAPRSRKKKNSRSPQKKKSTAPKEEKAPETQSKKANKKKERRTMPTEITDYSHKTASAYSEYLKRMDAEIQEEAKEFNEKNKKAREAREKEDREARERKSQERKERERKERLKRHQQKKSETEVKQECNQDETGRNQSASEAHPERNPQKIKEPTYMEGFTKNLNELARAIGRNVSSLKYWQGTGSGASEPKPWFPKPGEHGWNIEEVRKAVEKNARKYGGNGPRKKRAVARRSKPDHETRAGMKMFLELNEIKCLAIRGDASQDAQYYKEIEDRLNQMILVVTSSVLGNEEEGPSEDED